MPATRPTPRQTGMLGGQPVVMGSTGGWQPLATYTGYQNQQAQAAQGRQNALNNMPRVGTGTISQPRAGYGQTAQQQYGNTGQQAGQPAGQSVGQAQQQPTNPYMTNYGAGIQTSVQPQTAYTPQLTQMAMNQAYAGQQEGADMDWQRSQQRRPGQAMTSPGLTSQALPGYASAMGNANQAMGMIPWQDAMANAGMTLQGQVGRENEGLGWAGIQSGLQNAGQSMGLDMLLNLMRTFVG